jgi:hypothetical protein
MPKTLTASDRSRIIRLASGLPKGSDVRRAILAGLGKTGKVAYRVPNADLARPGDIFAGSTLRPFPQQPLFYKVLSEYVRGKGFEVQPLQAVEVQGKPGGNPSRWVKPGSKTVGKKMWASASRLQAEQLELNREGVFLYRHLGNKPVSFLLKFDEEEGKWEDAVRNKYVLPL